MTIIRYILGNLYLLIPILLTLGVALFFAIFFITNKVNMYRRMSARKIAPRNTKKKTELKTIAQKNTWLNYFLSKIDEDRLELKLIHCGNILGMKNVSNYLAFKAVFTLFGVALGIELFDITNIETSTVVLVALSIIGFMFVDITITQATKDRETKINNQLPDFLLYFDNYYRSGLHFDDILSTISEILKGELKKEVIRFNVNYSMTKDFENSLKEFIKRLGTSQADSIEVKLRQCFFSGIYDDVINDERELIDKKVINDMSKETKTYELYLALAMALLVCNLFLWLIYPLLITIKQNMVTFN